MAVRVAVPARLDVVQGVKKVIVLSLKYKPEA